VLRFAAAESHEEPEMTTVVFMTETRCWASGDTAVETREGNPADPSRRRARRASSGGVYRDNADADLWYSDGGDSSPAVATITHDREVTAVVVAGFSRVGRRCRSRKRVRPQNRELVD
jgi:hypothetical protein